MTASARKGRTDATALERFLPKGSRCYHVPSGHTLVELMVVLCVVGLLASLGIPRFTHAIEQSRVDIAAANLRAIWTAQRLYWLKHQTYAESLQRLIADEGDATHVVCDNPDRENFLDPHVNSPDAKYVCTVTSGSPSDFTATVNRADSVDWFCNMYIDSKGTVTQSDRSFPAWVVDPSGNKYNPSTSFQ